MMLKRIIVWSLIYSLILAPANYALAQTSIQADQTAPGANQPQVLNTAGGKPQVNISTPNSSGLSHNKYSQFDVGREGVILNNSRQNVQTQLGGWIEGNPNLAGGAAKTILNEVNSSKPSQFKGFVEVGGQKADVIIANPSGINVDGGGFINAGRATLTTGKPQVAGGNLSGFRVEGGHIEIEGQGLNAKGSDYTDIISKSVKVNAGIWAGNLGVTTGSNVVSKDNSTVTPISPENVTVALDVSELGGMYAGQIKLIGTDKGLGVRNAGDIVAQVGEVVITQDGRLENTGTIHGQKALRVNTAETFKNEGRLQSADTVSVKSTQKVENEGEILATKAIDIQADQDVVNTGDIQSSGAVSITSGANILNENGASIIGQNSLIKANEVKNLGLIDGGEVVIRADFIQNIFTGTIFGDHVALEARNILNGLPTSIADGRSETYSGLIGARSRLDVGVEEELRNRENGVIYSAGGWAIGQSLDSDNKATGTGGQVINSSAVVDVAGTLFADVASFQNLNDHYRSELRVIQSYDWEAYLFEGDPTLYFRNDPTIYLTGYDPIHLPNEAGGGGWNGGTGEAWGGPNSEEDFYLYEAHRTVWDTFVLDTAPGFVNVGGDMIVTGQLVNNKSVLEVAGSLLNNDLINISAKEPTIIVDSGTVRWAWVGWNSTRTDHERNRDAANPYNPAPVYIYTERKITPEGSDPFATSLPGQTDLSGLNSNLYTINPAPTSNYLIETNPRLTDYRKWLSSDFMLARLNADPTVVLKRLGDGFYEQRLVREQIGRLTGLNWLDGYESDEEQYQALMLAGVEFAEEFGLALGLSLSAEQMAHLTSDIVWLEYVTVETAQGPAQVLAPKVYLAPGREPLLTAEGGIVAARNVLVDSKSTFENNGNLLAANVLSIKADQINNVEGTMAGGLVSLAALGDINNLGGSIIGQEAVQLLAGGDINIASTTVTSTTSQSRRTDIKQVATVEVRSSDGTLIMEAEGDINLKAAAVSSAGDAGIYAGGDLNVAGVNTSYENRVGAAGGSLHIYDKTSEDVGSYIATGGALDLAAGRDLNIVGSQVYAGGDLAAQAGRDVSITEGRSTYDHLTESRTSSSTMLSSSSREKMSRQWGDEAIGSDLSGETVTIVAGRDFNLRGSSASASEGLTVLASENINITGAENTYHSETLDITKKSGMRGVFEGGRVGFSVGSNETGQESADDQLWHSASIIGSAGGEVNLYAGKDVLVSGSHVVSGTGDLLISGENVTVDSQFDIYDHRDRQWTKQSALTISVGLSGGAAAAVLSNVMDGYNNTTSAQNALSDRASALYGIAAARNIYDAGMGLSGAMDEISGVAQKGGLSGSSMGVNISAGYSTSKSESKFESHDVVVASSTITSGGDTTIVARGDKDGNGGDLNIIGSQVSADGWVTLAANHNLNLISAEELSTFESSNKSTSAGASVSYGFGTSGGGWGGSANYSQSKGNGSGETITHVETVITGAEGVIFASDNDTLLRGAQIIGGQVIGQVGGNLTIISEQDTSKQHFEQKSIGGSVSVGSSGNGASFNYSNQQANGSYASVNEQSGIFAGDGGFDLTVGGHTSLVGAVIDSTASPDKNQLTTASLSVADIHNHSDYSATTRGFGVELDDKSHIAPTLPMSESGHDSSETRSAIAGGTITITDEAAQKAHTGQTAEEVLASLNRDTANAHQGPLAQNPDLQEILDKQAEIVDAAGKAGPAVAKTIGDIADAFSKEYDEAQEKAAWANSVLNNPNATDEQKALAYKALTEANATLNNPELRAEWEKWQDGGIYKIILHTAGAALIGELGNGGGLDAALGAMASQLASKKIDEMAREIAGNLTTDPATAERIANLLQNLASGGVGALAGGESGANAASNMDKNNRQLHPKEIDWIETNADDFVALLQAQGITITTDEAIELLSQQALRQVDAWWNVALAVTELQMSNEEYIKKIAAASAFLASTTETFVVSHDNRPNTPQKLFTVEDNQFGDAKVFAELYLGLSGQAGHEFYEKYVLPGKTLTNGDTLKDAVNAYYIDGMKSVVDKILTDPGQVHENIWFSIFDYAKALSNDPTGTIRDTSYSVSDSIFGLGTDVAYQLDSDLWKNLNRLYGDDTVIDLQSQWFAIKGLVAILPIPGISAAKGALKETKALAQKLFSSTERVVAKDIAEQAAKEILDGVCFTEETLVLSKDGLKKIKDIAPKDEVYAQSDSGESAYKVVTKVFENETSTLVEIKINQSIINATPEHPFWVVDQGWVKAGDLKTGDELRSTDGSARTVSHVKTIPLTTPLKVYNFEVTDFHTYFVSNENILVHNKCGVGGNPTNLPTIEELIDVSKLADPSDKSGLLSSAGRALQKHGGREGSAFPKPSGNQASINAKGEEIINDILTNPDKTITVTTRGRYGEVMDIKTPDGRGLRFTSDGKKFIGFLEPDK